MTAMTVRNWRRRRRCRHTNLEPCQQRQHPSVTVEFPALYDKRHTRTRTHPMSSGPFRGVQQLSSVFCNPSTLVAPAVWLFPDTVSPAANVHQTLIAPHRHSAAIGQRINMDIEMASPQIGPICWCCLMLCCEFIHSMVEHCSWFFCVSR